MTAVPSSPMATDKKRFEEAIRLRHAVGHLARKLHGVPAADVGLTPSESSVLGSIARFGPLTVPELVQMEHMNSTMLSRIVGKLVRADLVERRKQPEDLRAVLLGPTPAGRKLHARVQKARADIVIRSLERLTADEQNLIVAALPALEALSRSCNDSTAVQSGVE